MTVTFRDIKADILARITRGDWGPGTRLPGEVELAESYRCSRATVNRAMCELAQDGIVERRRKAGTRVRMAPLRSARFEIPLVRREIEEGGAAYGYALLLRRAGPAPGWLRGALDLPAGARALHLTCLHEADGAPYQLEDRWISLAALPEAEGADFAATGPNEWLVATVPFTDARIAFTAAKADGWAAGHLGCAEGDALFAAERSTWEEGRAITFVRLLHPPGHRMTARY